MPKLCYNRTLTISHVFTVNYMQIGNFRFFFSIWEMAEESTEGIQANDAPVPTAETLRQRKGGVIDGIKQSAKEAGNALMQQRLKSWQPVMSPKYVEIS